MGNRAYISSSLMNSYFKKIFDLLSQLTGEKIDFVPAEHLGIVVDNLKENFSLIIVQLNRAVKGRKYEMFC